jgi:hypothetical protein
LRVEEQDENRLVIIKEPSDVEMSNVLNTELRNEFAMCAHLADVSDVRNAVAIGEADLSPYLVLEYINGQTLTRYSLRPTQSTFTHLLVHTDTVA